MCKTFYPGNTRAQDTHAHNTSPNLLGIALAAKVSRGYKEVTYSQPSLGNTDAPGYILNTPLSSIGYCTQPPAHPLSSIGYCSRPPALETHIAGYILNTPLWALLSTTSFQLRRRRRHPHRQEPRLLGLDGRYLGENGSVKVAANQLEIK